MPISIEHERMRQAAADLLSPDDFEGIAYDDITRRAAELCAVPIAIITVIDGNSQLFRSRIGTDLLGRPRESTFCAHAIRDPERITVVEDASKDARFASNTVVTDAPHIRSYAGVPLMYHGQAIGALACSTSNPGRWKRSSSRSFAFWLHRSWRHCKLGKHRRPNRFALCEWTKPLERVVGVGGGGERRQHQQPWRCRGGLVLDDKQRATVGVD